MTLADAIREAMVAFDGEATTQEVAEYIHRVYPGRWKDISTAMYDLSTTSNSSAYARDKRFLEKVGHGRYRLIR